MLADTNLGHRRLAACLVLRELAIAVPTLFFVKSRDFFDRVWAVLKDGRVEIRVAAGGALAAALGVLAQRPGTANLTYYFKVTR